MKDLRIESLPPWLREGYAVDHRTSAEIFAAYGIDPGPPLPKGFPTKPGEQAINQIAGTFEEQFARCLQKRRGSLSLAAQEALAEVVMFLAERDESDGWELVKGGRHGAGTLIFRTRRKRVPCVPKEKEEKP